MFGPLLATAGYDGKVLIAAETDPSTNTWDVLHIIESISPVICVQFIPHQYGLGIVYGSCDGNLTFLFYDSASNYWAQVGVLAHHGGVHAVNFAPEFTNVNTTALSTNLTNGQSSEAHSLQQHQQALFLNVNPTNQKMMRFVSGGADGCARIWSFDVEAFKFQFLPQMIGTNSPLILTPNSQHFLNNFSAQNPQNSQNSPQNSPEKNIFDLKPIGPHFNIDNYNIISNITLSDKISTRGYLTTPSQPPSTQSTPQQLISPSVDQLLDGSLNTHKGPIRSVLWVPTTATTTDASKSLSTIVTCSDDGAVIFWSVNECSIVSSPPTHSPSGTNNNNNGNLQAANTYLSSLTIPVGIKSKVIKPDEIPYKITISADNTVVAVVSGVETITLYSQTNNHNIFNEDGQKKDLSNQFGDMSLDAPISQSTSDTRRVEWTMVDSLHGVDYVNDQINLIKTRLIEEEKAAQEAAKEEARRIAEEARIQREQEAEAARIAAQQVQLAQQQAALAQQQAQQQQWQQQQAQKQQQQQQQWGSQQQGNQQYQMQPPQNQQWGNSAQNQPINTQNTQNTQQNAQWNQNQTNPSHHQQHQQQQQWQQSQPQNQQQQWQQGNVGGAATTQQWNPNMQQNSQPQAQQQWGQQGNQQQWNQQQNQPQSTQQWAQPPPAGQQQWGGPQANPQTQWYPQ
jgi:hypothetical protein